MRIPISFIGAVTVTLMLFYLMMGFIRPDSLPSIETEPQILVNIEKLDAGRDKQDSRKMIKDSPPKEPTPDLNSELAQKVQANMPTVKVKLNVASQAIELNVATLPVLQKHWIQPSGLDAKTSQKGLDDQMSGEPKSIKKIIPASTRMPNIPKVAWENKINGWVLLSFTVTSEGKVKDIRILDASPRGIFEEDAVYAARQWRYEGFVGHDRFVSQRIDFAWENYPYNWD